MRYLGWLLLACSLFPGSSLGQVAMEAHLGLQGVVRLEKWNPLTIRLHNAGSTVSGTLEVRIWRGSELRGDLHIAHYQRPVELPPRARKRLTFTVPIASITHPVEVTLRTGDTVVAQQHLDLRASLTAEQIILGVTRDFSLDFLATIFPTHTRIVYIPGEDLPTQWQSYDSVSAMVLKGISLQTLAASQIRALQQWLARGGTLVVAGDSQYALLMEPRFQSLLPVRAEGLQTLDELSALATRYRTPLPSVPVAAVRAPLTRGQVLIGSPDLPLLAQCPFGKGRVVFLALDYATRPLLGWQGNAALWTEILQPVDTTDPSRVIAELGLNDEAHPILKLLGRPILDYPSHLMLSVFLLVYCSVLGLLFWGMKRFRKYGVLAWSLVGLVVLGATLWAYQTMAARGLRQTAFLWDLTVLETLPQTGMAHLRGAFGIFSSPGGEFAVTTRLPDTILRQTFTRGTRQPDKHLELVEAETLAIQHIALLPWTLRLFSMESLSPVTIQVAARRQQQTLTIHIENQGSWPLDGTLVLFRGLLFPLGTIPPGDALLRDLLLPQHGLETPTEHIWQAVLKHRSPNAAPQQLYLQESLLQYHFGDKRLGEISKTPLLLGWIHQPGILQQTPDLPSISGMTLVVNPLPSLGERGYEGS